MSYEGFEQAICKNGHWKEFSCYSERKKCPTCGAPFAWTNGVDETNGIDEETGVYPGYINPQLLLVKPAVVQECNLGHVHETSPAIYRIPDRSEHERLYEMSWEKHVEKL